MILNSQYATMYQGPQIDLFGQMSTKLSSPQKDPLTGVITLKKDSVTVRIAQCSDVQAKLSVGTHKLLDLLIMLLSQQNTYRSKSNQHHTTVELELNDYMMMCAIRDTEASKDETRTRVKRELDLLSHISIEWIDMGRGRANTPQYRNMRLFVKCCIKRSIITATFTEEFASYLINAFCTKFPLALFKLDGRNSNAYYIGKKLAFHYGLHSNIKRKTNSCISVSTLLSATPDIRWQYLNEQDPGHWKKRIKAPLEKALDALKANKVITSWNYCYAKKTAILDIENETSTFFRFSKLHVAFDIKDFPLS